MLHKNIYAEGLLRALAVVLGDRIIRLVDGLRCPRCQAEIRNDPEETDDGWRIICHGCHRDLFVIEESR
jgi:hypothetical protein